MPDEIKQLEENILGDDYIIGDVHGSAELSEVVAKLKPNDRLFIVGDLFDRGGDEVGVYNLISQDPRIHAVKGNHEEMLLDATRRNATSDDSDALLRNGGGWLSANTDVQNLFRSHISQRYPIPSHLFTIFKNSPKIPETAAIRTYVSELPYIIRVGQGANAFNICHANMPISDASLDSLLQSPEPLSSEIKSHLVWARQKRGKDPSFDDFANVRSEHSIPVYCGHNILATANDAVRKQTNHINLDGGAFFCNYFIMVNHTQKTVNLVGGTHEVNEEKTSVLREAVQTITDHIRQPRPVQQKADALKQSTKLNELKFELNKLTSQFQTLMDLLNKSKRGTSSEKKYEDVIRIANLLIKYTEKKASGLVRANAETYLNRLNRVIGPILADKTSTIRFTTSKSNELLRALLQSGKEIVTNLEQQATSNNTNGLTTQYKESLSTIKNQTSNDEPTISIKERARNNFRN